MRVVDTATVGRNTIDALIFVHMALCLLFKKKCTMVKTKAGRPDHVLATITPSISIQKCLSARTVLKAVDLETATRKQIDASKLAHTDSYSCLTTTLPSMAKKYRQVGADVVTLARSLMT